MTLILRSDTALSAPGDAPKLADIDSTLLSLYQFDGLGLANGSPVATANPTGGTRGLVLSETTASQQPTVAVNALGGHSVLDFTRSSSQRFRTPIFSADQAPPLTIACVARRKTAVAASGYVMAGGVSGAAKNIGIECESSTYLARGVTLTGNIAAGVPDTAWHLFVFVVNGEKSRFYIDGFSTPGNIPGGVNDVLPRITLGCNVAGTANYLDGQVAEVREYGRPLSAEDVAKLRLVCRQRYGTANLS